MDCNTGTGKEAAGPPPSQIQEPNFMLNWDPGNAAALGSTPYPDGYRLLPHDRIGHCHAKDVVRQPGKKYEWAPVGGGSGGLGGSISRPGEGWLSPRRKPGNALARCGHCRSLHPRQHERVKRNPEQGRPKLLSGL